MQDTNIIIESIGALHYGGVFLLALASNMLIPVPEEIILLLSGYLIGTETFQFLPTAAIFIFGMFLSDIILFYLARHGSRYVKKLRERLGRWNITANPVFVERHIKKIIFFSRFLIYIRFIGPVLSGSVRTPWKTFLFYDFIALLIYVPLVLSIGHYFHANISLVIAGAAEARHYFLLALGLILVIVLARVMNKSFLANLSKRLSYMPTIIPGLWKKEEASEDAKDALIAKEAEKSEAPSDQ